MLVCTKLSVNKSEEQRGHNPNLLWPFFMPSKKLATENTEIAEVKTSSL